VSRGLCGTVGLQGSAASGSAPPLEACLERNDARQDGARVPLVRVYATRGRFVPPSPAEGFDGLDVVRP
jgi:hypothetical protein